MGDGSGGVVIFDYVNTSVISSFDMPTIFTHAFVAAALGKTYSAKKLSARFRVLSILCAVLPDADVISFSYRVQRGSMFGHRGITHSLLFALVLALLVVSVAFRGPKRFSKKWWALTIYFFLVTASHGLLDALTDGGSGVAFFAPFDSTRYFFPWRPIEVSPIGMGFFSDRGLDVFVSEFIWVWIPATAVMLVALSWRRLRR